MTLIINNTVKVFQMQCSNIKKLENDRGLILERKYDLLCRNIANGKVKSQIPVEEEECIADRAWHACNVTCWNSGYKTGAAVETDLVTIYPTEHFEGICNSDIFVTYRNKIYVADSVGWTIVKNVQEAISRIIFYNIGINWNEIRNKEDFAYFDNYLPQLRKEQDEELKLINRKLRKSNKTI
jgi:hypothetical protein